MPSSVDLRWGVEIPMRDGVRLSATLYTPKDQPGAAPCILAPTPYSSDAYHDRAVYFASRGWPFLVVDARGRGNSGGQFRPMLQEGRDGHDVVEWVARQSWCDGKVAMLGGSYAGHSQWVTAREQPPHLTTIVPTASPYVGVDFPMRNNVFSPSLAQWLMLVGGHTCQMRICSDGAFWSARFRAWYESGRPFRELDDLCGNRSTIFQEWLSHPEPDAYWDAYNPGTRDYARIDLPILTITASYDDDQPGALEHYRRHLEAASAMARARHYLVIGPWDHAGTGTPRADVGGLTFAPASVIDMLQLHEQWYAWTLRAGPRPEFLKKTVAYYVMGAERWRYADSLEAVTARHQPLYLDSTGNATDIYSAGLLGSRPGAGVPSAYTYDPCDIGGLEVEAQARTPPTALVDQSITLALTGRLLVYQSPPYQRDTEVSGFFKLSAWIAIDCPDTDLYASVYEIGLDGGSIRLSTDAIRARYREDLRTPKLISTGEPLRYDFERFTFVSRRIKRGHRLRLVISPVGRLIEATFPQRNCNSGGVVSEESIGEARAVTVKLFHSRACPSALYVPVGQPEEQREVSES